MADACRGTGEITTVKCIDDEPTPRVPVDVPFGEPGCSSDFSVLKSTELALYSAPTPPSTAVLTTDHDEPTDSAVITSNLTTSPPCGSAESKLSIPLPTKDDAYDPVPSTSAHTGIKENDKRLRSQNAGSMYKSNMKPKAANPHAQINLKDFLDFVFTAHKVNNAITQENVTQNDKDTVDWNKLSQNKLVADLLGVSEEEFIRIATGHAKEEVAPNGLLNAVTEKDGESVKDSLSLCSLLRESKGSDTTNDYFSVGTRDSSENITPLNTSKALDDTKVEECIGHVEDVLKSKLNEVLQEGILDSVLPYIVPKQGTAGSQNKKPAATLETKKNSVDKFSITASASSMPKVKLDNQKKGSTPVKQCKNVDSEVEIHVCDEVKNLKKNFKCSQKLLVSKMGYFAEVSAGQNLEDMDISVHCDIAIFDWLMRWVKKDDLREELWPALNCANVIPVMISSAFLQMDPLLTICLHFCRLNMNEIIRTSTTLTCLNDSIFTRLSLLFTNTEVEALRDKNDKVQSRFYCKLIMSLAEAEPEAARGHYGSLARIFKCSHCGKLVTREISSHVPCAPTNMRLNALGFIVGYHSRSRDWTLSQHIQYLRMELKTWRRVYWRLWALCHFIECSICKLHFPASQYAWCSYHPEQPQYFTKEDQQNMLHPIGRFPCCGERAYRFEALYNPMGCLHKEHTPILKTANDKCTLLIIKEHPALITAEPPKRHFPLRLTKLVRTSDDIQKNRSPTSAAAPKTDAPLWWKGLVLIPKQTKRSLLRREWERKDVEARLIALGALIRKKPARAGDTSHSSNEVSSPDTERDDTSSTTESNLSEESACRSKVMKKVRRVTKRGAAVFRRICARKAKSHLWENRMMTRYNQDNQRDHEEKIFRALEMVYARRYYKPEHHVGSTRKSRYWANRLNPAGGSYVRLEANWREANFTTSGQSLNATRKSTHVNVRSRRKFY